MAKSRVEKNKKLYNELELESFEVEDLVSEEVKEEPKKEEEKKEVVKKQELVPVKKPKKNEVAVVKETKKIEKEVIEEDFIVEQPISYTDKLSVEEILRAKLETQQKLKDSKKGYKKTPNTKTYTPEMMQKNINQKEGVDIRKEANIRVRKNTDAPVIILALLLLLVIVGTIIFCLFYF